MPTLVIPRSKGLSGIIPISGLKAFQFAILAVPAILAILLPLEPASLCPIFSCRSSNKKFRLAQPRAFKSVAAF
jgi:hypothetical protein